MAECGLWLEHVLGFSSFEELHASLVEICAALVAFIFIQELVVFLRCLQVGVLLEGPRLLLKVAFLLLGEQPVGDFLMLMLELSTHDEDLAVGSHGCDRLAEEEKVPLWMLGFPIIPVG